MSATSLTLTIAGSSYNIWEGSLSLPDQIEQRSKLSFMVHDPSASFVFKKGQRVIVSDTLEGLLFDGRITDIVRDPGVGTDMYHTITCVDKIEILDGQTSNKLYVNQYAGVIAVDQIKDQWVNGILATFAIDQDTTQANFKEGNLSGTVASANVDDGNLELAPAGSALTIVESTTSNFSTGSLTNATASSNTLAPTATSAIKLVGTESLTNDGNAYSYIKIFTSGAISVISGRYLEYDVWVDPASPSGQVGVDIIFTDGTNLRDVSQDYRYRDSQNILPHPNNDISGFANGQWYHRSFLLDNVAGKTISHVDVVLEGNKTGVYTAYFKNVLYTNGAGTTVQTFFNGSFNVNPPQQMQNSGYSHVSCTIVNTYDCSTSNRVSSSYSINHVNILKSTFISWLATEPANTAVQVEYSIDGGNSYTVCTNDSPLPNLPAGLNVASKSIQFRQSFLQLANARPDDKPFLTSMHVSLVPSYTASKTDATWSGTTNAEWNAGGMTFTNTQVPGVILELFQAIRNWSPVADLSNMSIFGGAAGGTGPTTVRQHCNLGTLWVEVGISLEGRSRLDFTGNWADACVEVDIYIDSTSGKPGLTYRTTNTTSNYDNNYAYCIECTLTSVALTRGSNSNAASLGTRTVIASSAISIASASWHRLKVIYSGSNHQIFIDDVRYINATDGTYTAAGAICLRASNSSASAGYQGQFQNFGVTVTGLSGTFLNPSTSLTSLGTYLNSVISWQDVSAGNQSTNVLVESTINGGSSWQTLTNGGPVSPNFTPGQSLSGISFQLRVTLSTASASSMPMLQSLVARVLGGFSSSGTRVHKALLLSNVVTCGSTIVAWNAITPPNTSVAVATSLDGTSYTSIANGGAINGITQQPAPTIDSFNLNTSGSYLATFQAGGSIGVWNFDTVNSRVTVNSGTATVLLNSAISVKDVDVVMDADALNQDGLVWRWQDASNFYELLVFDASSDTGTTNILKLFKIVSNVTTQIGSNIAISFKRGQQIRFRVLMVGTSIQVWMDGVRLINTTDAALAGPGKVGLMHVSGTGINGGSFHLLRIQPQGDNLTGKLVYVKETLTSTDPLSTPQITNTTTLVTNPNIGMGSLVPLADYRNTYKTDNIKDLAKRSNYYWNVKQDGSFIFLPRTAVPAPWVLSSSNPPDILDEGLSLEDSADAYRNRQTLINVQSTAVSVETLTGNGTDTTFTLGFPVVSMTSMVLNGQSKTFGLKGTTGADFYYAVGDSGITQDASGDVLQKDFDQLVVGYVGQTTTTVTRDNTGQFPGTTSQRDYLDQSGLSIPVQIVLNQASAVINASGNSDDLDVSLVKRIAFDANITAQSGTSPTVRFFIDRKATDGSYVQIYDSGVISTLTTVSTTIGPKCTVTEVLGTTVRARWTIGGSASPTKTFLLSIQGRVDPGLAGIGIVEAVEDVSSMNLDVPSAQALGDSRLQQLGVIGQIFKFKTERTGLAVGQYLTVLHSVLKLNDAALLITKSTRTQASITDSGSQSQCYRFDVTAVSGPVLSDWEAALNDTL
jgi:hypothetical protein